MRKLLAIAALTALLPFSASAQYIASEAGEAGQKAMLDRLLASSPGAQDTHFVPMWSTPDGRLLVAVAQSSQPLSPIAPASPQVGGALDWRLIDATSLLDGRVGVRLGDQSSLHAGVSLAPLALSEPLSLDCLSSGSYLSVANPDCSRQRQIAGARWYGGNLGASWSGGDFGIDLGLALSWLEPALPRSLVPALSSALPTVATPGANSHLPRLVIPTQDLGRFSDSTQFGARGSWYFSNTQSIDLGASIGRIRLSPDLDGTRPLWQQKALSLGLGGETLSASITGRIYNPLRSTIGSDAQRWTGIDLGLTWHTPWQAELSIGAQNLLASPPLTGSEANSQARTPYVQYQQDL